MTREWWVLLSHKLMTLSKTQASNAFCQVPLPCQCSQTALQDSDEPTAWAELAAAPLAPGLLLLIEVVLCRADVSSYLTKGELLLLWHQDGTRQTLETEMYQCQEVNYISLFPFSPSHIMQGKLEVDILKSCYPLVPTSP